MKKDRVMDIHNRETTINLESHELYVSSHRPGVIPGETVGMSLAPIDRPDLLATVEVELLYAHVDKYPNGVAILSCGLNTGQESSTYSIDFQIRSTPNDGSPTAVETVATAGSIVAEDDGSLSATDVAVDEYIYAILPITVVSRVNVWVTYTVN